MAPLIFLFAKIIWGQRDFRRINFRLKKVLITLTVRKKREAKVNQIRFQQKLLSV